MLSIRLAARIDDAIRRYGPAHTAPGRAADGRPRAGLEASVLADMVIVDHGQLEMDILYFRVYLDS